MNAQTAVLERIQQAAQAGQVARVSDDTMRFLFGSPDSALTPEQQFRQDFVGDKPDALAGKKRRAFCAAHGLTARQDAATGYWSFTAMAG